MSDAAGSAPAGEENPTVSQRPWMLIALRAYHAAVRRTLHDLPAINIVLREGENEFRAHLQDTLSEFAAHVPTREQDIYSRHQMDYKWRGWWLTRFTVEQLQSTPHLKKKLSMICFRIAARGIDTGMETVLGIDIVHQLLQKFTSPTDAEMQQVKGHVLRAVCQSYPSDTTLAKALRDYGLEEEELARTLPARLKVYIELEREHYHAISNEMAVQDPTGENTQSWHVYDFISGAIDASGVHSPVVVTGNAENVWYYMHLVCAIPSMRLVGITELFSWLSVYYQPTRDVLSAANPDFDLKVEMRKTEDNAAVCLAYVMAALDFHTVRFMLKADIQQSYPQPEVLGPLRTMLRAHAVREFHELSAIKYAQVNFGSVFSRYPQSTDIERYALPSMLSPLLINREPVGFTPYPRQRLLADINTAAERVYQVERNAVMRDLTTISTRLKHLLVQDARVDAANLLIPEIVRAMDSASQLAVYTSIRSLYHMLA